MSKPGQKTLQVWLEGGRPSASRLTIEHPSRLTSFSKTSLPRWNRRPPCTSSFLALGLAAGLSPIQVGNWAEIRGTGYMAKLDHL